MARCAEHISACTLYKLFLEGVKAGKLNGKKIIAKKRAERDRRGKPRSPRNRKFA
jgi:hypothetical protein